MSWFRATIWLAGSAYTAAFILGLGLQLALTGTTRPWSTLPLDALFPMLFTLPIVVVVGAMLLLMNRFKRSILRSRLLILPVGVLAGLIVALVSAPSLLVLGLAFGFVTGASCLTLHLLLVRAGREGRGANG